MSCDKLTSVWYYGIDYGFKKFYGTGPRSVDEETRMKGRECCKCIEQHKTDFQL